MKTFILLLPIFASIAAAVPPHEIYDIQDQDGAFSVSRETEINAVESTEDPNKSGPEGSAAATTDSYDPSNQDAVEQEESAIGKNERKGRKHKALFIDYPFVPRIPNYPSYDANGYDDIESEERTPGGRKRYQESNIYYIRLPPTPYMFVPGLGYISQPPTYSTGPLRPQIAHVRPQVNPFRPQNVYQPHLNGIDPFINLPLDFVSNGKPTSVYQWQAAAFKPLKRPDSRITTLDKGPYFFNGRPQSLYLLRPDAQQTLQQAVQYPDYQDNGYY